MPIDADFANDTFKAPLEERLPLLAGKQVPDPFVMISLSKDMSCLPSFDLLDFIHYWI